jgi:hypothetical protein
MMICGFSRRSPGTRARGTRRPHRSWNTARTCRRGPSWPGPALHAQAADSCCRDAGFLQHPQAIELAGGLDDPGQHQMAEHLVPRRRRPRIPAPVDVLDIARPAPRRTHDLHRHRTLSGLHRPYMRGRQATLRARLSAQLQRPRQENQHVSHPRNRSRPNRGRSRVKTPEPPRELGATADKSDSPRDGGDLGPAAVEPTHESRYDIGIIDNGIMVIPTLGSPGPTLHFEREDPEASDKSSDNGPSRRQTEHDILRHRYPSGLP